MTVRNVDSNLVQIIRDLQEEVKQLKGNVGATRLNSIRLDNWVLEAVDDSLVKMTNLATGEESYIGGVGGGGDTINNIEQTVVPEFPPFCVGGVVRIAFGNPIRTNIYTVPNDITISTIIVTIASPGSGNGGFVFTLTQNGTIVYTSPACFGNKTVLSVSLAFVADDDIYMSIPNDGDGDSTGLQVMLRV